MPITPADSDLPPLYARWTRELLGQDPPRESRATCLDCVMAPPPVPVDGLSSYAADLKCCTYTPVLPNFLVGAVLAGAADDGMRGRASIEARMAAVDGVTPLGLDRPAAAEALYAALAHDGFGLAPSLRCPHLTGDALCGIWRHRNAVCATWFCKHERGAVGERFWAHVGEWLREIERQLSTWCLAQAGLDAAVLARLLTTDAMTDDTSGPERLRLASTAWGAWRGREAEFYQRCAALVDALTYAEVERIGGAVVAARGTLVRQMFERLADTSIPERLEAAPLTIVRRTTAGAIVSTYRSTDLIELEQDALDVVARFDGRPTAEVLRALEEEDGLAVEPDLVGCLRDFEVLREPGVS